MTKTIPGWGVITWRSGQIPDGRISTVLTGMAHEKLTDNLEKNQALVVKVLESVFEDWRTVEVGQWKLTPIGQQAALHFRIEVFTENK